MILEWCSDLFNLCWRDDFTPDDWRKVTIAPLYKGKGSKANCGSYRAISLLSQVGKLYGKILIERARKVTVSSVWEV